MATFMMPLTMALMVFYIACASTNTEADSAVKVRTPEEVKSVFLYNFIKFVEWPADHSPSITHKAAICIMGNNPFGNVLDGLKAKLARTMELTIKSNVQKTDVSQCQLLFIGSSDSADMASVIETARINNVLTVSELNNFADKGGIIEMNIAESTTGLFSSSNIRLRINLAAAEAASLKINAQLLEIAAEVIK